MAMAGDEIVRGITQAAGQDGGKTRQVEPPPEVGRDSERRVGAQQHTFGVAGNGRFHPRHRVGLRQLGMPGPHLRAEDALERSEAERPAPVVPQYELHAVGAEAAGSIVQEYRPHISS